MKIISEEQIEAIKDFIKNRNTLQIRKILNELEEPEEKLKDELRKFLMNKGKSDITKKEIWDILDKIKSKREVKMTEDETQEEEKAEETSEDSEEKEKAEEDSEKESDKEGSEDKSDEETE